jgi:hypothetical protein
MEAARKGGFFYMGRSSFLFFLEGAMKKFLPVFAFSLFLFFPTQARASGVVGAAAIIANDWIQELINIAEWVPTTLSAVAQLEETITSVKHLYDQLEHMKQSTKRAIDNLKGILSVGSLSDFMSWFDRQLYLEREVERRYNNLDVTIGGKSYHVSEIDKIPETLKNDYADKWANGYSEEDKKKLWAKLGLSPGNYMYLQTWVEREKKISQRVRTLNDVFYEELNSAAERNSELMSKFAVENESLDINEISKDQAALLAQIELAVREGNIATTYLGELIQTLDEKNNGAYLYNPYPLTGSNFYFEDISNPDTIIVTTGTPFADQWY